MENDTGGFQKSQLARQCIYSVFPTRKELHLQCPAVFKNFERSRRPFFKFISKSLPRNRSIIKGNADANSIFEPSLDSYQQQLSTALTLEVLVQLSRG